MEEEREICMCVFFLLFYEFRDAGGGDFTLVFIFFTFVVVN